MKLDNHIMNLFQIQKLIFTHLSNFHEKILTCKIEKKIERKI